MKVVGLIVEYNPFHKGHIKHIKNALSLDKDVLLIAVMSPNFVQRGEPAIIPKEKRVKSALKHGVDLVVELPTIYALESAEYFAKGALSILNDLGCNDIIFGSETGNTDEFISKYKLNELGYIRADDKIEEYLNKGYSYPKALSLSQKDIQNFYLEYPNDILGYEYIKEIEAQKYPINVHTYKRENNENSLHSNSALAIRNRLKKYPFSKYKFHFLSEYFGLLKYILLTTPSNELSSIHLVDEGIENYLIKNIRIANNMDEFIRLCSSKRYTSARIKRTICHILLHNNKEEVNKYLSSKPYIRILGYNSKGQGYLNKVKHNANIVSRFSAKDNPLLLNELKSTEVYYFSKKNRYKNNQINKEKTVFPIKY